jgi:N-acetylglutamate synthase-like GNAT family acetyltransferase
MLDAARKNLGNMPQTKVIKVDFSNPGWVDAVAPFLPFDIIVSGFAIHHQPDERKKALYSEIYHMLSTGGVFLNLEHVSSRTPEVERIFDDYFIDLLFGYHSKLDKNNSREDIEHDYYRRPDKKENILAPVDDQCRWLREIGLKDVDCFFKIFELSIFGGRKVDLNDNENKSNEDLIVIDANIEDARQILSLQKRAYIQEVEKAGDDYGISPMRQTLSEMEDDFKHYVILKAMKQSLIVGSVRARMHDEICYIGRLIVEPIFQQQGYGALLLKSIEARFPQASEFELFTGENSSENIRFYSKRGYALVENFTGPNGLKLVKMRKKGRNFSEGWLQP